MRIYLDITCTSFHHQPKSDRGFNRRQHRVALTSSSFYRESRSLHHENQISYHSEQEASSDLILLTEHLAGHSMGNGENLRLAREHTYEVEIRVADIKLIKSNPHHTPV